MLWPWHSRFALPRHPGDFHQLAGDRPALHGAAMRIVTILPFLAAAFAGCTTPVGPPGPPGPPGPQGAIGPAGPLNAAPQRLALVRTATDLTVADDTDVVITDGAAVTVTLPPASAAPRGRVITVRAFGGTARIVATAGDRIDAATGLDLDRGEMASLISDGATRWIIISSSDL